MSDPKTRRFFLGALTAASAIRVWGANDKVNVGIVGLGGRGSSHLNIYSSLSEAQVVGICDVNQAARERAQATLARKNVEKASEFEDMRQMFADPKVEAVSIATPNHWHALAAIWAMKAGKDVYGEKPACYNIHEGMRMLQVQRESKRIMQVGSQHRSWPFKIKAITALQQGLIGKLYMSKALCLQDASLDRPHARYPTPAGLNWDLFLGPAPMRPFNQKRSPITGTGSGTPATGTSGTRVYTKPVSRAGRWAIRCGRKRRWLSAASSVSMTIQKRPISSPPASLRGRTTRHRGARQND